MKTVSVSAHFGGEHIRSDDPHRWPKAQADDSFSARVAGEQAFGRSADASGRAG